MVLLMNPGYMRKVTKVLLLIFALCGLPAAAQAAAQPPAAQTAAAPAATPGPGISLYRELLNPAFDLKDVHKVRDVSILREDLHISISDGTMALMRDVDGHVTGAVFDGEGEVLLVPPNRAERTSLALFTGSAVLEQRFQSALFRFFDDKLAEELRAGFRGPADDAQAFIARWQEPARLLAQGEALPLLQALTSAPEAGSEFLHLRVGGTPQGIVDIFFSTNAPEQITVAHTTVENNSSFFDIWASFPMRSAREAAGDEDPGLRANLEMSNYVLRVKVQPPTDLNAEAEFTLVPKGSGQRMIVLELSRYLKLAEVKMNGAPVEFIQNESISGSELSRRGDDLIGIMLPAPLEKDRPVRLSFKYSGPVMFSAGEELVYVGSRGTWYPNAGPSFSTYDITFEYPSDWTLIATGKQVSSTVANGLRTSRFVADRQISRAGFNMGRFVSASASAGKVAIEAFGARNVEPAIANAEARAGRRPDPARETQQIADRAASTVHFLSEELEPFPYSTLAITQLPGLLSQSWPGLIYLSSSAFLSSDERRALGIRDPYIELLLSRLMLSHEAAHQWWGDAVDWVSYRDEWIVEALANYCALMMLEKEHAGDMKEALDYYRNELLRETSNGIVADAGPVTLGYRLTSSKFPYAYERVLYGRGTWLIHMLRMMLRETSADQSDALFFSALKGLLAASPSHKISTLDLERAFEKIMPASLNYDGRKSLDWFFDSWINGNSIPQFSLQNIRMTPSAGKLRITGSLLQNHAAKDMVTAVPIYAVDASGAQRFLAFVFADDTKTEFTLSAPAGTREILMDPEESVLRR
jgi:hypothetical protein